MADITKNLPALGPLRLLVQENVIAKLVLEDFSRRKTRTTVTQLDKLMTRLDKDGQAPPRSTVIHVLRDLARYGCGDFIAGRRGHPSRFEANYALSAIGAAALTAESTSEVSQSNDRAAQDQEGRHDGERPIEHKYQLRAGWQVSLLLPGDLTAHEASRLSAFVQTLPFEKGQE